MKKIRDWLETIGVAAFLILCLAFGGHDPAYAQNTTYAKTVSACGSPGNTPKTGSPQPITQGADGKLCVNATVTATLTGSTSNASSGVATSATNIPTVAFGYGFNGTTWDQLQVDASKYLKVDVAAGTVGNPCASATSSATPADACLSGLSDGTNLQPWLAGIALGDGVNGNNTGAVAGFVWNGTTWDRMPGGTTGVTVAQGTATNLKAQVSVASGGIASGAVASGAIASGAVASGAFASGSLASGAISNGADVVEGIITQPHTCATSGYRVIGCLGQIDDDLGAAQGATTSGIRGPLIQGSVTTSSPSYTTGQTDPLSLDTSGSLRVNVVSGSTGNAAAGNTGSAVPAQAGYTGLNNGGNLIGWVGTSGGAGQIAIASGQVASGAIASGAVASGAIASGALASGAISNGADVVEGNNTDSAACTSGTSLIACTRQLHTDATAAIPAGTNLIGKVGVDQTTPGTTNAVSLAQINAATTLAGQGASGTGTQRVTIANDLTSFPVTVSTATTTQIIAASGSTVIHVRQWTLVTTLADNVTWESADTGGACANPVALTGAMPFAANGGAAVGSGSGDVLVLPSGKALCMLTSASTQISGSVAASQF